MRLLHVGSGFRPWHGGGLVAYVEDLMDAQVQRGHEVSYVFAGRHYPLVRRPRLRRRERRGIAWREILNSPLHDHGFQPDLELGEPAVEELLARVIDEQRPDLVHVHELAGLPSSVFEVAARAGVPAVFTLQDYFALCPMFKLLDHDGAVCLRTEVGADCVATAAADRRPHDLLYRSTLSHDLWRVPFVRHLPRRDAAMAAVARTVARRAAPPRGAAAGDPAAYQRRRDVNVARLNRVDRLLAMSTRVAEIYETLGVEPARLRTMHLTLAHIARLRPRRASGARPVTFGTLAAFESEAKGARLVLEAVRRLSRTLPRGSFRVLVFGTIDPRFAQEAAGLDAIELREPFEPARLDAILDEIDVGLVPSVWEEAYAFAGVEFLAKAIPVIGNAIGGIPDYVRDGQTGWLNRSCSAEELARIMEAVAGDPAGVRALNARLIAGRDRLVETMGAHAARVDELYAEVLAERR